MPVETIQRRIPWPRGRHWRPGEPLTLTDEGVTVTYRLRGVFQDPDPSIAYAVVSLEPMRTVAVERDASERAAS